MADDFLRTFQGADFSIMMSQAAQDIRNANRPHDPRRAEAKPAFPAAPKPEGHLQPAEPSALPPWHLFRDAKRGTFAAPAAAATPFEAGAAPAAPPVKAKAPPAVQAVAPAAQVQAMAPPAAPVQGKAPPAAPAGPPPKASNAAEVFFPTRRKLEESEEEIKYLKRRLHNSQRGGRNETYYSVLQTLGPEAARQFWQPPAASGTSSSSSSQAKSSSAPNKARPATTPSGLIERL